MGKTFILERFFIQTSKQEKRVVKTYPGGSLFAPKEEIFYEGDVEPFDEPQIGDYARPLKR